MSTTSSKVETSKKKIAVIGTGRVGASLGTGWSQAGYEVFFGSRDPNSQEATELMSRAGNKASVMSIPDSVSEAEIVALAIPWNAVEDTLRLISPALSGKILIDCTNPTFGWPAVDHSQGSGATQVARLASGAKVVKAFNTTGFENMQNPRYGSERVTMFYAGDDAEAKRNVHELAQALGFDPVDAGGLAQAQTLEVLASFWGNLAYTQKMGRGIAFRLMRRTS